MLIYSHNNFYIVTTKSL